MAETRNPKAPSHLGQEGKKFWRELHKTFDLVDPHDLKRATMLCECVDTRAQAREMLQKDGHYFRDRWGQIKPHPAHAVMRDQGNLFCRIVSQLGLDLDETPKAPPGRPSPFSDTGMGRF
jgi:P27 family predicted phage terminase small subunit